MPYRWTDRPHGMWKYFLVLVALSVMSLVALHLTLSVAVLNADNIKQQIRSISYMRSGSELPRFTFQKDGYQGDDNHAETANDHLETDKHELTAPETDKQGHDGHKQASETDNHELTAPETDEKDHAGQKQASMTDNQQIPKAKNEKQASKTNKQQIQEAGNEKKVSETDNHELTAPETDGRDHDGQKQASETNNQQIPETENEKQVSETDNHERTSPETDEQGHAGSNKGNQPMPAKTNDNIETRNKTKYLIYLCDNKTFCYGFGDRMAAVASVYYLAEITNRRFGLIMTSPTDIREFYEPNLINWDIPASELPVNATTKELVVYGPQNTLNLDIIDFNAEHTEDIIYIRTNQELWHTILINPVYRDKIPKWASVYKSEIMPRAWLRLVKPTAILRRSLNYALMDIAQEIQEEEDIRKRLDGSNCCQKSTPGNITVCDGVNVTHYGSSMTTQESCYEYNVASFKCYTFGKKCPFVDSSKCFEQLKLSFGNSKNTTDSDIAESAQNYCTNTLSSSTYEGSVDSLGQLTDFNVTNMNLICAHIRLGDWMTFKVKGKRDYVKLNHHKYLRVWNFFQGFAKKGHHFFVASDSPEWKEISRSFFGKRMHTLKQSSEHGAMAHIAFDRGGYKARDGMLFALTEQLLLATSCQELLISESGFSLRPSQLRPFLMRANKVWKLKTKSSFQIYQ